VNAASTLPRMVDVGQKAVTERRAIAECTVKLPKEVWAALKGDDIVAPKGPVLATATVAGVAGAKRTSELMPFCHGLALDDCQIEFDPRESDGLLGVRCSVLTHSKTGVEMEALTGASVAALCVYDMCKAISHRIVVADLRLVHKSGGKSGLFHFDHDGDAPSSSSS